MRYARGYIGLSLVAMCLTSTPISHAALRCMVSSEDTVALQEATSGQHRDDGSRQACKDDCVANLPPPVTFQNGVAAPAHIPVVSPADEIAAWHAEIFDQLSRSSDQTIFCKRDL